MLQGFSNCSKCRALPMSGVSTSQGKMFAVVYCPHRCLEVKEEFKKGIGRETQENAKAALKKSKTRWNKEQYRLQLIKGIK